MNVSDISPTITCWFSRRGYYGTEHFRNLEAGKPRSPQRHSRLLPSKPNEVSSAVEKGAC